MSTNLSNGRSHSINSGLTSDEVDNLSIGHTSIHPTPPRRSRMKKEERKQAKLQYRVFRKASLIIPHVAKMVADTAHFVETKLPLKVKLSNMVFKLFAK